VGFTAWLIMLALTLTSTAGMIRRLGGKRCQALHRLVYGAAIAGIIHYWWSVKADVRDPRAYAVVVTGLLAFVWGCGRESTRLRICKGSGGMR
jgi:methionine sulfoxide reductase heme-binding subunit